MRRSLLVVVLLSSGLAWATTHDKRPAKCPVDGADVELVEVMSSNSFGGQDTDLMPRAVGDQPFMVATVTCPRCHYSGRGSDFEPGSVPEPMKKAILGGALKVPELPRLGSHRTERGDEKPGLLPAWARLDLAAQTDALRKPSERQLAHDLLEVAWAVRLEEDPFADRVGDPPASIEAIAKQGTAQENPAQQQVALAKTLLSKLATLPAADRRAGAILAGHLLRTHGEHPALLAALPTLLAQLPPADQAELDKKVKVSVELEQRYQREAVKHLEDALKTAQGEEQGIFTYLLGETERRLGQPKQAREQFQAALALAATPDWIKDLAKSQLALVP